MQLWHGRKDHPECYSCQFETKNSGKQSCRKRICKMLIGFDFFGEILVVEPGFDVNLLCPPSLNWLGWCFYVGRGVMVCLQHALDPLVPISFVLNTPTLSFATDLVSLTSWPQSTILWQLPARRCVSHHTEIISIWCLQPGRDSYFDSDVNLLLTF